MPYSKLNLRIVLIVKKQKKCLVFFKLSNFDVNLQRFFEIKKFFQEILNLFIVLLTNLIYL